MYVCAIYGVELPLKLVAFAIATVLERYREFQVPRSLHHH